MTAAIPMIRDESEQSAPRAKILVIDDNAVLARSFARMLRMHDTTVETDPVKAVQRLLAGEQFDVVMCDLRMPNMDGREVLKTIRNHFAGRTGMPHIIMMSGSDEISSDELDTPVLLKPCYSTEVRAMVNRLVDSRPSA
ncbi:MAG TPA: response regulator [Kofleriaceae bacterium]